MKSTRTEVRLVLAVLIVSGLLLTGCQVTTTTTPSGTSSDSSKTGTSAETNAGTTTTPTTSTTTDTAAGQQAVSGLDGEPVAGTATAANQSSEVAAAESRLNQWSGGRLSPADFVAMLGPIARATMQKMGVPASIIIAQAALETGWGASSIGTAKNLFGIKGTGPAGSVSVPTREYGSNGYYTTTANFRKYNTWQESVEDHSRLLSTASRYSRAMAVKHDPKQFAREIHRAGYATDPRYAEKLIQIMDANNLYQWNN